MKILLFYLLSNFCLTGKKEAKIRSVSLIFGKTQISVSRLLSAVNAKLNQGLCLNSRCLHTSGIFFPWNCAFWNVSYFITCAKIVSNRFYVLRSVLWQLLNVFLSKWMTDMEIVNPGRWNEGIIFFSTLTRRYSEKSENRSTRSVSHFKKQM